MLNRIARWFIRRMLQSQTTTHPKVVSLKGYPGTEGWAW